MLEDREAQGVRQITLSYTMHPGATPADETAGAPGAATLAQAGARDPLTAPRALKN